MNATRTRKSADERKAEIIKATLELAGEIGPDRLTTEALAARVGISQAGIFRHFPSKAHIWEAVGKHIGAALGKRAASVSKDRSGDPIAKLQKMIIGHFSFIEGNPAIPAILFSRELHAENDKLRGFFARLIASRHRIFAELLEAGARQGQLRKDLRCEDAAWLLLALIQGLAMRWSLNARNFDLAREGERLLQLQLEGFGLKPNNGREK
jgi:AcrR family transcriptional regulator